MAPWYDKDGKEQLNADTEVKANTEYKWVFISKDGNYEAEGIVTLWHRSSGGGSGATKTETTTDPDGSVTKTEIKFDGTVIETTTGKDGSTTRTETKPDGSSVTERKDANGSTGTAKTDKDGNTRADAKLSDKAVEDAKKSGEAVKVPAEVKAGESSNSLPPWTSTCPRVRGRLRSRSPWMM